MLDLFPQTEFPAGLSTSNSPLLSLSGELEEFPAPTIDSVTFEIARPARLHPVLSAEWTPATTGAHTMLNENLAEPQLRAARSGRSAASAAKLLLHAGRIDDALEILAQAETRTYWTRHYQALATGLKGEFEGAKEAFLALAADFAEDSRPLHALGRMYISQNRLVEAHAILEKATRKPDVSALVFSDLGLVQILQGNFTQAIKSLRCALRKNERCTGALTNLGVCYQHQGRTAKARRYFNEALACSPRNTAAVLNLTECLIADGSLEEAGEMLESQSMLIPNNTEIQERLAWVHLQMNRPRKAKSLLLKAVASGGKPSAAMLNNLALTQSALGEFKAASDTFEKAIAVASVTHGDELNIRCNYASYLVAAKKWQLLVEVLPPEAVATNPGAALLLLPALLNSERAKDAAEMLHRVLSANPNDNRILIALSYTLICHLDDPDAGIRVIESAGPLGATDMGVANNRAYGLIRLGRLEEADAVIRPFLDGDGDESSELRLCLLATWALLQMNQGRFDEGLEVYRYAKGLATGRLRARFEQKIALEQGRHLLSVGKAAQANSKLRRAASGTDLEFAREAKRLLKRGPLTH